MIYYAFFFHFHSLCLCFIDWKSPHGSTTLLAQLLDGFPSSPATFSCHLCFFCCGFCLLRIFRVLSKFFLLLHSNLFIRRHFFHFRFRLRFISLYSSIVHITICFVFILFYFIWYLFFLRLSLWRILSFDGSAFTFQFVLKFILVIYVQAAFFLISLFFIRVTPTTNGSLIGGPEEPETEAFKCFFCLIFFIDVFFVCLEISCSFRLPWLTCMLERRWRSLMFIWVLCNCNTSEFALKLHFLHNQM